MASLLILFAALTLNWRVYPYRWAAEAQTLVPPKFDGFVYGGKTSQFNPDAILIEAFFDPVCPDTRDAWPPLQKALQFYGSRVSLTVHTFPLPYHDNAFVISRALHIVNDLNSSATYPLLELFFKDQVRFYNQFTSNKTMAAVVDEVIDIVTQTVGNEYYSTVKSGFSDQWTDLKTRVAFKYGCSRGVYGTPTFLVNGLPIPDAGSSIGYNGWRKIIDPLINTEKEEWVTLLSMNKIGKDLPQVIYSYT